MRSTPSLPVTPTDCVVLVLVASLPFGGYVDLGIGGHLGTPVLNIALLAVAAGALAVRAVARGELSLSRGQAVLFGLYGCFLLWQWLSLAVVGGPVTYYHIRTTGYLLLLAVVVGYVDSPTALNRVLAVGFAVAVVSAALTVLDGALGLGIGHKVIDSRTLFGVTLPVARTVGVPLTFGAFGIFVLGTLPTYALVGLRDRRAWTLGACLVVVAGVAAQTRSTWVAAGAAAGVVAAVLLLRGVRRDDAGRPLSVAVAAVGALSLAVIAPAAVDVIVNINSNTVGARLVQYRGAIAALTASPLFGVGPTGIAAYVPVVDTINSSNSVHNAVLNVGAASGLPALLWYVAGPVYVAASAFRRAVTGDASVLLLTGMAAAVVAVVVDAQFLTAIGKVGWLWIAVAAGHEYWLAEPTEA